MFAGWSPIYVEPLGKHLELYGDRSRTRLRVIRAEFTVAQSSQNSLWLSIDRKPTVDESTAVAQRIAERETTRLMDSILRPGSAKTRCARRRLGARP